MTSIYYVQKAIDYIEAHLCEPLELQEIADNAFMSVPNLYRAFYARTGHSIKAYIRKRRISLSAYYLRASEKPIMDISFECGFDSYEAFTKMFKKLVGMTPGMYRKSDVYYSFESINLFETAHLKKDLTEQYPDVKVIRCNPMQVIAYLHQSSQEEGIEEEAFQMVVNRLESVGWSLQRERFFCYNVPLSSKEKPYGYEMMIPVTDNNVLELAGFRRRMFPGGLYAVGISSDTCAHKIVTIWNRLFSEWLPRSTFELGDHQYVEELLTYKGSVTRMKLYLPLKRKKEPDTIETAFVDPFTVYSCKAYGSTAEKDSDDQMVMWLHQHGLAGKKDLRLLMSYSYGVETGADYWYELSVVFPEKHQMPQNGDNGSIQMNYLGGGLYARFTTGAYGTMTGVLAKMHQWLHSSDQYFLDNSRKWFAEYVVDGEADIERATLVTCYVPILEVE